jgi:hypothetical protein
MHGLRQKLEAAMTEVLEKFAFLFADADAEDASRVPPSKCCLAEMTFIGPQHGTVELAAPCPLCFAVAGNVLGTEAEAVTPDIADDAIKELLNVTCGRLVESMFGDEAVVDLTAPRLRPLTPDEWSALHAHPDTVRFIVEGQPLLATVSAIGGPIARNRGGSHQS